MSKKNNNKNNKKKSEISFYIIMTLIMVALIGIAVFGYFYLEKQNKENEVTYTEFIKQLDENIIEELRGLRGGDLFLYLFSDTGGNSPCWNCEAFCPQIEGKRDTEKSPRRKCEGKCLQIESGRRRQRRTSEEKTESYANNRIGRGSEVYT